MAQPILNPGTHRKSVVSFCPQLIKISDIKQNIRPMFTKRNKCFKNCMTVTCSDQRKVIYLYNESECLFIWLEMTSDKRHKLCNLVIQ